MTFKTTRGGFDSNFKSRNETGFTSRSSKLQSRPGFGNEQGYFIFVLKTPVTNGIQATDMRSKLQQRIDSNRLTIQNQLPTRKQIIAIPTSDLYADAFGIMNGCLDAAFLKADIAARIMKLPKSMFLRRAAGTTGIAGLMLNGYEAYKNRTSYNYAKVGVGLVLLGVGAWGGATLVPLVIAGNVSMIAWDLGEGLYEHLKKNQ